MKNILKYKRFAAFACAVLLAGASLFSCSQKWNGYEESDLGQYIKLGQYKGITVKLKSAEVTEEELQAKISETLAAHKYESEVTDRASAAGDFVRVDYSSTVDGVADTNFMGADMSVQIGSGTFFTQLDNLEGSLAGHTTGETFKATATFPDYYKNENIDNEDFYNGKTIIFEFTVKKIYELLTPELTDEFVAKVSSVSTTVDQYKEELRASLAEQKAADVEQQKSYDAWAAVMDASEVLKYPQSEIDAAIDEMKNSYASIAKQLDPNMKLEDYVVKYLNMSMDDFEAETLTYAKNTVSEELALYSIIRQEKITISDEEYETGLSKYAEKYSFESPEAFESYYGTSLVRQSMLWDKTISFILENATIISADETAAIE